MCGIVAVFRPSGAPVDPGLLDRMTDALAHRGPDGRGTHLAPGCGLGHRRLAIIDLAGGAQPIFSPDERFAIVFNGEVYDYLEARPRLPGPWRTRSDTEVFLRSFEVEGLRGIERLTGMWGAAIWDAGTRTLAVIRDRLGKKPVYYAALPGGGFAFASEIRALLVHPEVERAIDPDALHQLLTYRYVPAPRTLLAGVKKLPPGHAAFVSDAGLRIERYWAPHPSIRPRSDAEAEDEFLAAFDRSVALRMVSDVPVGLFLSGGLDSTAVLHAMRREGVHCFTVAFSGGEGDDEIPLAAETARRLGARHHAVTIGPADYEDYLDRYAAQLEEPVLNDSAMACHFLSRLARTEVKVVLSGQGADEPLAGYDRYKGELVAGWLHRAVPFAGALVAPALRWAEPHLGSEKLKRAARSLGERDPVRRALRIYAVFQEEARRALVRPELPPTEDVAVPLLRLHAEVPYLSPLERMLYTDTRVWLADDLLLVADKLSMAHGLELRTPFLDHRMVELVESMPLDQKIRLSARGVVTKRVHRAAQARRLPPAVLERRKLGFDNPVDRWLRRELRPLVEERLLGRDSPIAALVDPAAVRVLHEAHQRGAADHRRQLFLLLTLEAWMRWALRPEPAQGALGFGAVGQGARAAAAGVAR